MYKKLYNSMVRWHWKYYGGGRFAHVSAALTLSVMVFLNLGSALVLCAYWHFSWAASVISLASPLAAATVAVLLTIGHLKLSSWWRTESTTKSGHIEEPGISKWPAGVYMLFSVVVFLEDSSRYSSITLPT